MDDNYLLATCRDCGNKGLLKKAATFDQQFTEYEAGSPFCTAEYNWVLLECPVCKSVSLYRRYNNDLMIDYAGNEYYEEAIVYPEEKSFPHVPKDIVNSYSAAVKTSKVDLNVSLIAIRAVLEKICKERGTNRKKLEAMLKQMVERHILPETLDKCGFIIRKLGNSGAHGDDTSILTRRDVEEFIDFIETIMYYIYELPVKIDSLNRKYELQKTESEEI